MDKFHNRYSVDYHQVDKDIYLSRLKDLLYFNRSTAVCVLIRPDFSNFFPLITFSASLIGREGNLDFHANELIRKQW
jgi:hypothetical protein